MLNFKEFKKFFIFCLIGSLIVSALVAVITVLIGEFNEVTGRVFFTLAMVVVHSFISLAFIWDDERQNTFERLAFFINVLFTLIVLSFLTSIFGIWKILPSDTVARLYQTFFVIGFASLHGDVLSKVFHKERYLDTMIYANYLFIAAVVLMLEVIIFTDNAYYTLGEMYYRVLGAVAIVDGTLSVLTIIFYKLYIAKHPEEQNILQNSVDTSSVTPKKRLSIWVWIFLVYITFQILIPIMGMIFYGVLNSRAGLIR